MRLAVNVSTLSAVHTGIPVYAHEILSRLPLIDPDLEIFHFLGTHWQAEKMNILRDDPKGSEKILNLLKERLRPVPGARTAWNLFKKNRFTSGKNTHSADIYWEPSFIPPKNCEKMVTTVHDLSHIRFPEYHPKSRLRSMESLADVIEASQKILTVSEFSKDEIIDVFGTPADKIIVTYNAPADRYKVLSKGEREPVLKKFGLKDKSYFLSVCTLEPRKNLKTVLRAYNLMPKSIQEKIPLVLVGRSGWGQEKNRSYYNKLCPSGNIIFTGYVDAVDLPALFGGAKSFVYPSVYEGFG